MTLKEDVIKEYERLFKESGNAEMALSGACLKFECWHKREFILL